MAQSSMRRQRNRKFKAEINVVPYIDVMLVLLVIFMVAAPITNPSVINLPSASRSTQPPTDYIEIVLKPAASASIGIRGQRASKVASREQLIDKLAALHKTEPDLPVMISADKEIKYDEVVYAISEAKKLGINRVGLATR